MGMDNYNENQYNEIKWGTVRFIQAVEKVAEKEQIDQRPLRLRPADESTSPKGRGKIGTQLSLIRC